MKYLSCFLKGQLVVSITTEEEFIKLKNIVNSETIEYLQYNQPNFRTRYFTHISFDTKQHIIHIVSFNEFVSRC